jgi:hypothetical protein
MLSNFSAGDALQHRIRIASFLPSKYRSSSRPSLKSVRSNSASRRSLFKTSGQCRNLRNLVCRNAALERLEHTNSARRRIFSARANLVVGEFA